MKKLIPLILFFLPVQAEEATTEETCQVLYNLAEKIMEARQNNLPMPKTIEIFDLKSEAWNEIARSLITTAYEKPRFSSEPYQKELIQDFANDSYLSCIKGLSK